MLIDKFLDVYYKRYPNEIELDPSIEDIYNAIGSGISIYIDSNILILYSLFSDCVIIHHYWYDGQYDVRTAYRQHKKFIRLFSCDVYIKNCKSFYNKKYIYKYINNLHMYKFIK